MSRHSFCRVARQPRGCTLQREREAERERFHLRDFCFSVIFFFFFAFQLTPRIITSRWPPSSLTVHTQRGYGMDPGVLSIFIVACGPSDEIHRDIQIYRSELRVKRRRRRGEPEYFPLDFLSRPRDHIFRPSVPFSLSTCPSTASGKKKKKKKQMLR